MRVRARVRARVLLYLHVYEHVCECVHGCTRLFVRTSIIMENTANNSIFIS